jgi:AP-2 complex subunit sigma-1
VDLNENELTYLELIHLFVESMDIYFGNVCELDIVFNFQKVYMLLDEVILGGEILETSKRAIRDKMLRMDQVMEKEQVSFVSRLFGTDS